MARAAKDDGQLPGIATPFIFGPLIDSPPAHPDTVLSTLSFNERFLVQHGMTYMHISADLQIYRIILQVKWSNQRHWENIVIRPGGMHMLMSFVGCIGTLIESTGLEDLLNLIFNGVTHMLNGKAWPKANRGLRIIVLAIIKPLVMAGKTRMTELAEELEKIGQVSRTGRLWVECLIMPVMIIHIYLRTERTGDWLLHMYALK